MQLLFLRLFEVKSYFIEWTTLYSHFVHGAVFNSSYFHKHFSSRYKVRLKVSLTSKLLFPATGSGILSARIFLAHMSSRITSSNKSILSVGKISERY